MKIAPVSSSTNVTPFCLKSGRVFGGWNSAQLLEDPNCPGTKKLGSNSLASPGRRQSLDLDALSNSPNHNRLGNTWCSPWWNFRTFSQNTLLITLLDTWQGWKRLQKMFSKVLIPTRQHHTHLITPSFFLSVQYKRFHVSKRHASWIHTRQKLRWPSPFVAQVPTKASTKPMKRWAF